MKRARSLLLGAAGIAIPVLLALSVYFVSAGSLASTEIATPAPAQPLAQPSTAEPAKQPAKKAKAKAKAKAATKGTTTGEDVSGKCDEAEHANDPECTGAEPADEDNSGSGSGDGSGSDDSGSGGSGSDGSGDDD